VTICTSRSTSAACARASTPWKTLSPGNVQGIPSGAAVDGIKPEAISLLVERRVSRTVHLQPRIEGAPSPGFALAGVELDPDHVILEGPESELAPLSMTATEPILLDGRTQTFIADGRRARSPPRA
jgi:hypothetical protein